MKTTLTILKPVAKEHLGLFARSCKWQEPGERSVVLKLNTKLFEIARSFETQKYDKEEAVVCNQVSSTVGFESYSHSVVPGGLEVKSYTTLAIDESFNISVTIS